MIRVEDKLDEKTPLLEYSYSDHGGELSLRQKEYVTPYHSYLAAVWICWTTLAIGFMAVMVWISTEDFEPGMIGMIDRVCCFGIAYRILLVKPR